MVLWASFFNQTLLVAPVVANFKDTSTDFEKYCSCDKVCQFSAWEGTPWRSYLENLTIDDKCINKRVRLFIHQTMCLKRVGKKKLLGRHKVAKWLFNYFLKRHWSSHLKCSIKKLFLKTSQYLQKQPPDVFYEKRCSLKFHKIHKKTPVPEFLF